MSAARLLAAAALAASLAGLACREDVTAPGSCPSLGPSAHGSLVDTVLTGIVTSDSTFRGFYAPREAPISPLADLDSLHSIPLIRFGARDSTWYPAANDTAVKVGRVDSVYLRFAVASRDLAATGLRIIAYRIPSDFDTGMTFAQVQPSLADSQLVDTIAVDDTLEAGTVRWRLSSRAIARLASPDTGVAALALVVVASRPTALSVGQTGSSMGGAYFDWYVHAQAPRDSLSHVFSVGTQFDTFVHDPPDVTPSNALAAGGLPSARAILHLDLPAYVLDSARLVRATLILTAASPVRGMPAESFRVSARGLIRDLGPKSMLYADTSAGGTAPVTQGDSGEIHIEVGRLLRGWGTTAGDSLPRAIMLLSEPEGASLGEVRVARWNAGAAAPRLRVTFVRPYPFGVP